MFSTGPKLSRYYFARGDHWCVYQEDDGETIVLQRKDYLWWHFISPCLVLPGIVCVVGTAHFIATGDQAVARVLVFLAIAAGGILMAIYQVEWLQLRKRPRKVFVWRSNGRIEILGNAYIHGLNGELTLEYSFYPHGTSQSMGAFSELDIVIRDRVQQRRINLLSQKSNWALKHARQLHQHTQLPLQRRVVAERQQADAVVAKQ